MSNNVAPTFLSERSGLANPFVVRHEYIKPDPSGRDVHFAIYRPNDWTADNNGRDGIVVAPGFTEGINVMSRFAVNLATQFGQTVVLFDHHRDRLRGELPQDHKTQTLTTAAEGYCERFEVESYELIGHSEGGIHSARHAANSDRVTAMTLVGPAGLVQQSFKAISRGVVNEVARDILAGSITPEQGRHMGGYLLRNIPLSWQEGRSIAATDTHEEIRKLQEQNRVQFGVLGLKRDLIIPERPLRDSLPKGTPYQSHDSDHMRFINNRKVGAEVFESHLHFAQQTRLAA